SEKVRRNANLWVRLPIMDDGESRSNERCMITLQDVPIVESQRPELLPLDLQAELHLRSDRTAIAYRKWLKELGLTFGTA
ncbi:MAG TPA: hypothetical protein VE843_07540, partial [Ktedonobacteraceae bacterium]|nr:hypothetical protein [Ktedonobacteraceae bacterium]